MQGRRPREVSYQADLKAELAIDGDVPAAG